MITPKSRGHDAPSTAFTNSLEEDFEPMLAAVLDHQVVTRLGEGTLDEEPFRYWVEQDYAYLVEYGRGFAHGAATVPYIERMSIFSTLLDETLHTEMDLHRSYAAEFGVSGADLAATDPSPTTRAYTDFLVRVTGPGTFGDLVAALLPCAWGSNGTGRRLAERGTPDHELYAQ